MTIETVDQPHVAGAAAAAREIQTAATGVDAVPPFGEHVVLTWAPHAADEGQVHLLSRTAEGLPAGYAHLDPSGTLELAVHPDHRRQGHGRGLLRLAEVHLEEAGRDPGELRIWSHGDLPAARALAAAAGYRPVRELLQLRRPADAPALAAEPPEGVTIRAFRPGEDDEAWLALNARAFAGHPEQGRMTAADLAARMREPWFDPAGFLIAQDDDRMIGFHWTKVHPEGLGEVYVLGVDPDRHGGGLGRALLTAGLEHLHDRGLATVLLYVEADNPPALALYRRAGFSTWTSDVMYAR